MDPISPAGMVSSIRAPLQVPAALQRAPLVFSRGGNRCRRDVPGASEESAVGWGGKWEGGRGLAEGKDRKLKCCTPNPVSEPRK